MACSGVALLYCVLWSNTCIFQKRSEKIIISLRCWCLFIADTDIFLQFLPSDPNSCDRNKQKCLNVQRTSLSFKNLIINGGIYNLVFLWMLPTQHFSFYGLQDVYFVKYTSQRKIFQIKCVASHVYFMSCKQFCSVLCASFDLDLMYGGVLLDRCKQIKFPPLISTHLYSDLLISSGVKTYEPTGTTSPLYVHFTRFMQVTSSNPTKPQYDIYIYIYYIFIWPLNSSKYVASDCWHLEEIHSYKLRENLQT
jgi:hypothetical protein